MQCNIICCIGRMEKIRKVAVLTCLAKPDMRYLYTYIHPKDRRKYLR